MSSMSVDTGLAQQKWRARSASIPNALRLLLLGQPSHLICTRCFLVHCCQTVHTDSATQQLLLSTVHCFVSSVTTDLTDICFDRSLCGATLVTYDKHLIQICLAWQMSEASLNLCIPSCTFHLQHMLLATLLDLALHSTGLSTQ